MNLGSKTAAREAERVVRKFCKVNNFDFDVDYLDGGETMDGWTCLGAGSYRSVWTKDGKVAYKVVHSDPEENLAEWYFYSEWSTAHLPAGLALPRMARYGDVLAVEVVKGLPGYEMEMPRQLVNFIEKKMGLCDVAGNNYMVTPEGKFVILDMAY